MTANAIANPGPVITLRIPFNKPLAKIDPGPSPSKVSFIYFTASFTGDTIASNIGANVTLPTLLANCCKPKPV